MDKGLQLTENLNSTSLYRYQYSFSHRRDRLWWLLLLPCVMSEEYNYTLVAYRLLSPPISLLLSTNPSFISLIR